MTHHEQAESVNPIQVQKFLGGVHYPVEKRELLDRAKQQGADDTVMRTLQALPDKKYEGPSEVSKEIGKLS